MKGNGTGPTRVSEGGISLHIDLCLRNLDAI